MISSHRISGKAPTKIRPPMRCSSARPAVSRNFRGRGREVVLVGPGAELSCIGTEVQKLDLLRTGRFEHRSTLSLGVRMGFLKIEEGQVFELKAPSPETEISSAGIPLANTRQLDDLAARWKDYLFRNTGIRTITKENAGWDPNNNFDHGGKLLKQATDFGGAYPTGLSSNWEFLGLSDKELQRSNVGLNCSKEIAARALINAGFHYSPGNLDLVSTFGAKRLGVFIGTGMGPEVEHENLIRSHNGGEKIRPLALPNSLPNIAAGYLAKKFGIERRTKTYVGACESALGAFEDAYYALQRGEIDGALVGGFDDAMTASSLAGFNACKALITNSSLLKAAKGMLADGVLDDSYRQIIERIENDRNLPKEITALASMPFAKYSGGFVMGLGGGAGFLTTLDLAIKLGLPITATVAGLGGGVPDSAEFRETHIAAQGDGLGVAFHYAIEEARRNYRDFEIDSLGAYIAHGTSTAQGSDSERANLHATLKANGRDENLPLLITGDKGLQGHRIGGNYPQSLLHYIINYGIPPMTNYHQAGFKVENNIFGDALDKLYPLTAVAGKAGAGQGDHVALRGNYLGVGAMGFGGVNTFLLFRRFDINDISRRRRGEYRRKLKERQAIIDSTLEKIDYGQLSYYQNLD